MPWLTVHSIEETEGSLIRINDSVRVEQAAGVDGSHVWYGTVNEITVHGNSIEVSVTDQDGGDHQVDAKDIAINETQGW
jgi:hypothetical protein